MHNPYIVPFVAAKGNVGRTHALLEVARALVKAEKRVLVLDLDFTSPGVHALAGDIANDAHGMADLLSSNQPGSVAHLIQHSERHRCDYVTAGHAATVRRRAFRLMSIGEWHSIRPELLVGPWDFILVDMPPGNALLASSGAVQMVREASALCLFVQPGHEHEVFTTDLRRRLGSRPIPAVLIEALWPTYAPRDLKVALQISLTVDVPRLRALELPDSPAWDDPRFLSAYQGLAEKLVDIVTFGSTQLEDNRREVAILAIQQGMADDPTMLRSKVKVYLHPRVLVVAGRHGAGKTALARATDRGEWSARFLSVDSLPPDWADAREAEEGWFLVWQEVLADAMRGRDRDEPIRFVFDGIDEHLTKRINVNEARAALRKLVSLANMQEDTDPDIDVKIFVQPAWIPDLTVLLDHRQLRTITWTKSDLLELAIRRAIRANSAFARQLNVRSEVRISPSDPFHHESWSHSELEAASTALFGPQGLSAWTSALPEADESELVPEEAAKLLVLALTMTAESGDTSSALIAPKLLGKSVKSYARNRYRTLLTQAGISSRQLANAIRSFDRNDMRLLEALNWGLLRWTPGLEAVEVPPLVQLGMGPFLAHR